MTPFYGRDETNRSRELYEALRGRLKSGCTVIGGWGVYDSTTDVYDEQSRDVDVVFSTPEAFNVFRHEIMPEWNLDWAGTMRRPTNACRFQEGHGPRGIIVDVFFKEGSDACLKRFSTMGGPLWKDIDCSQWLPPVPELLKDKLTTLPKRKQADREQKRFKDAIDAWALIFHNVSGLLPDEFGIPRGYRSPVQQLMPSLRSYSEAKNGLYAHALDGFEAWLSS